MNYTIENDALVLTVSDHGAEPQDLRRKAAPGEPLLWDGQKEHWGRRSPLCFPWCSRVEGNWFEAEGRRYEGLPQHGFARDMDHAVAAQEAGAITFRLTWPGDDRLWPWAFTLETRHALEGDTVVTTCTAVNQSSRPMPTQLGFHVGLRCPFTPGRALEEYAIRFEKAEAPGGGDLFPLNSHSFDDDSICLRGLGSRWLQVEELDTGRYLRIGVEGYPYVLLWSAPGVPGFVCIEPWTGYLGPGHELTERPGTRLLAPGEQLVRVHRLTVGC